VPVHSAAGRGFARSALAYERGRPGYPDTALRWLTEQAGLGPGVAVVDLAAGTGKLTRALVRTGADVIAVEPVAQMRALIEPPARAVEGTAEDMPLPDGSADVVTVGQAFHWFDGDAALAEIARVLRPGGKLALLSNERPPEDPIHAELDAILTPYRGDAPSHRSGRWRDALARTVLLEAVEDAELDHEQELDAAGLADRVGSISFIAALPQAERRAVLERARALAGDGTAQLRYRTAVHLFRRLSR
jgi:SAM-dependent methyltransferase